MGKLLQFPPQLRINAAGEAQHAAPRSTREREQAWHDQTARWIATTGFQHDREPPTDWVARLREISPESNDHGSLRLVWEAGDPWVPGQRWTVCECVPRHLIAGEALEELEGPHPRSEGHMCSTNVPKQFQCLCRHKTEAWKHGPCFLVTLTQWKYYRRHGLMPVPFWVLQGTRGGHLHEFDGMQKQFLQLKGLPQEPPRLGDLPYAPFDERAVAAIMREQKLARMGMSLDELRAKGGAAYEQHKAHLARELRAEYVKHLDEQMGDVADLFLRAQGDMENEQRTEFDYDRAGSEESMAAFVETGQMLHPDQMLP